jgi:hypothetical protein
MYSVHQHWDKLETCIVGSAYPPEFFSFIENPTTRNNFEKMSEETEEDYQSLICLLNKFGVEVLRPKIPNDLNELFVDGKWTPPPTAPRDYFLMIGDKFYVPNIPNASHAWHTFYRNAKLPQWADCDTEEIFLKTVPKEYHVDFFDEFNKFKLQDGNIFDNKMNFYGDIFKHIESQGNEIIHTPLDFINGCFVSRIGEDLYFATQTYHDDHDKILEQVNEMFPSTTNHVVDAGGHGDAVFCPVTPGLIISLNDIPTYKDTFPDWEVVYLPDSDYEHMRKFEYSMKHNKGRWFMPGFEKNHDLVSTVEYYFDEWVGQVSETVFDVNILVIDKKNIVVSAHNDKVEEACARYGIEVHINPFRHKYFWDAGTHCITNDLNRSGTKGKWI